MWWDQRVGDEGLRVLKENSAKKQKWESICWIYEKTERIER